MENITIKHIKEKLTEQIALSIGEEPSNIKSDMLMHELGLDSLGLVELFVFIEKEFKIQLMESGISQEDIQKIDSLSESISKAINN
ncbi:MULTISPECIES: acyl carrier protein [Desulfobacula]|uniref:Acyl carrier protein n=2 Tax=Desulfobacula TaxID=28222 RepID=A0A1H2II75_9BACT|nr:MULTISPECIES: phosphopantetheine-binding protein [Desulfobacula]CCK82004.1 putative acyl-carrier protein-like protein [Desulfobacula toluolica Tol2]SDU43646.1 acyl carrier protein [Desulfobacula phenolica]